MWVQIRPEVAAGDTITVAGKQHTVYRVSYDHLGRRMGRLTPSAWHGGEPVIIRAEPTHDEYTRGQRLIALAIRAGRTVDGQRIYFGITGSGTPYWFDAARCGQWVEIQLIAEAAVGHPLRLFASTGEAGLDQLREAVCEYIDSRS